MFKKGLVLVLCTSTLVWAQFAVASISGMVTDEAGTPLGKVKVTVRHSIREETGQFSQTMQEPTLRPVCHWEVTWWNLPGRGSPPSSEGHHSGVQEKWC